MMNLLFHRQPCPVVFLFLTCHFGIDLSAAEPMIEYPSIGSVERLDDRINDLIPPDARIEKLAEGFEWSEGPVWDRRGQYLLFSDIPRNVVYKWQSGVGVKEFLRPSGYTGEPPRGGELGSNGLALDSSGRLVLCMHGDRRVARLEKDGTLTTLAKFLNYRRFNSPNDLCFHSNGDLYFTDPPYGLEGNMDDPTKELVFQGVYLRRRTGEIELLTSAMSRPNGIALSPDEQTLYVANSDPEHAVWMAYDVLPNGTIANGRVFFDATAMVGGERKGLPDGLKLDQAGNLWATGPGGVLVFTSEGDHLGTISTGEATANCGWGNDGSVLYLTSDMYLCRIQTSARGRGAWK